MISSLKKHKRSFIKRNKSHPRYRSTPSDGAKEANKVHRAHLKYGEREKKSDGKILAHKLESSDIDEIPGLESLIEGDNHDEIE